MGLQMIQVCNKLVRLKQDPEDHTWWHHQWSNTVIRQLVELKTVVKTHYLMPHEIEDSVKAFDTLTSPSGSLTGVVLCDCLASVWHTDVKVAHCCNQQEALQKSKMLVTNRPHQQRIVILCPKHKKKNNYAFCASQTHVLLDTLQHLVSQ